MFQPSAPTRDVLAKFLPNQLSVRAFENLFAKSSMIAPSYAEGQLIVVEDGAFGGISDVATGNVLLSGGIGLAPTYGKVGLTTHVSGILPVANGGTGIAVGTSGGILGFTGTSTIASSGLLSQNALMLGGGVGATPSTPLGLGTTTQVLHGNAAGAPTWSAVSLSADVSGTLSPANGGTGVVNAAASTLTITGAFGIALTVSGATALTLPTSGTVTALGNTSTGSGAIVLAGSPTLTGTTTAGTMDATSYAVGGVAGASFGPAPVASITVVNGLITAIS